MRHELQCSNYFIKFELSSSSGGKYVGLAEKISLHKFGRSRKQGSGTTYTPRPMAKLAC